MRDTNLESWEFVLLHFILWIWAKKQCALVFQVSTVGYSAAEKKQLVLIARETKGAGN